MNQEFKFNPYSFLSNMFNIKCDSDTIRHDIFDLFLDSDILDNYYNKTLELTNEKNDNDKWLDHEFNHCINKLHYKRRTFFNIVLNNYIQKLLEFLKIKVKKEDIVSINLFYIDNENLRHPFYSYKNYNIDIDAYMIDEDEDDGNQFDFIIPSIECLYDIIVNTYSIEIYTRDSENNYNTIVIYNDKYNEEKPKTYIYTIPILNKDKFDTPISIEEDYILSI